MKSLPREGPWIDGPIITSKDARVLDRAREYILLPAGFVFWIEHRRNNQTGIIQGWNRISFEPNNSVFLAFNGFQFTRSNTSRRVEQNDSPKSHANTDVFTSQGRRMELLYKRQLSRSCLAGDSDRRRVCDGGDDCETRKSSCDSCFRFREPVQRWRSRSVSVTKKNKSSQPPVNGVAIFPELSAEHREQGMTDFNDLGRAQPEVVSRQLTAAVNGAREGRMIRREHAPSMELAR